MSVDFLLSLVVLVGVGGPVWLWLTFDERQEVRRVINPHEIERIEKALEKRARKAEKLRRKGL